MSAINNNQFVGCIAQLTNEKAPIKLDPYAGWWRVYFAGEHIASFASEDWARGFIESHFLSWADVEIKQV